MFDYFGQRTNAPTAFYRNMDTAPAAIARPMLPLRVTLDVEGFGPPHMRVFFWRPQDRLSAWSWFDLTTN